MLYKKVFEFKGQQVNYYNKVRKNPDVAMCWMETNANYGLVVYWKYKENKTQKNDN